MLFWIEGSLEEVEIQTMHSTNFDGSNHRVVLFERSSLASDLLSLNVNERRIYFYQSLDIGNSSGLYRLDYAWTDAPTKLFDSESPTAFTVGGNDTFYSSNSSGLFRTTCTLHHPTLSFVNGLASVFYSVNASNDLINDDLVNASQIRILDDSGYPGGEDECIHSECEQECVSVPPTTRCACRFGYILNHDNRTCSETGYMIYSSNTALWGVSLGGEDHTLLQLSPGSHIVTFDVHIPRGHIFWIDIYKGAIYRTPLDHSLWSQEEVMRVRARGLSVDWVHDLLYWSEDTAIFVATIDGKMAKTIIDKRSFISDIAVDPLKGFVFWVEGSGSASIVRGTISGIVQLQVTFGMSCGVSLAVDPTASTLYWLDAAGSVTSYLYEGPKRGLYQKVLEGRARAISVLDGQLVWTPMSAEGTPYEEGNELPETDYADSSPNVLPTTLKAVKSSQQPVENNVCQDGCFRGLCLPVKHNISTCVCPDSHPDCLTYRSNYVTLEDHGPQNYLQLVDSSSFSVNVKYTNEDFYKAGLKVVVTITEISSLIARPSAKPHKDAMVLKFRPTFRVQFSGLTPATSYVVAVHTQGSRMTYTLTVHTGPPPLTVRRLPLVTLPGGTPVQWLSSPLQYLRPNLWDTQFPQRQYLLLQVSRTFHSQDSDPIQPERLRDLVTRKVSGHYTTLMHYKTKEEFDNDPTMYLGNLRWGPEFWLAMVQVTQYQNIYNLDIVYSKKFSLPYPH